MKRFSLTFNALAIVIGVVVFLGLASFSYSYNQMGAKEGLDFIWQLITFSFVLGTLCSTFTSSVFSKADQRGIAGVGLLFLVSGVVMIAGNGLFTLGDIAHDGFLKNTGIVFFIAAEICVAASIAFITMIFVERLLPRSKPKKR